MKLQNNAFYQKSPQSFHIDFKQNKTTKNVKSILNKINLKNDKYGVGYSIKGDILFDVLDIADICQSQEEIDCINRVSSMVQLACCLLGFKISIPDCIGFLFYYNRGLAGHVDYPFFAKIVFLFKLFESTSGGKDFGWTYKDNEKIYILENLVLRNLNPRDGLLFFGPLACMFDHGVSPVSGEAGMLSFRWQTQWSKSKIDNIKDV